LYQLFLQSLMHLEYRVALPLHGLLLVFAGVGWALAGAAAAHAVGAAAEGLRTALRRAVS
jgi:hypothetical protein